MDLVVSEEEEIVVDDNPPAVLASAVKRVEINALEDLTRHGLIDSLDTLQSLLTAAHKSTEEALSSRQTFVPFVPMPGTRRPDLRRYGRFLAMSTADRAEANVFWGTFRQLDPKRALSIGVADQLATRPFRRGLAILKLASLTIEKNATLKITKHIKHLSSGKILIKKGGKIVFTGASLVIRASSIEGRQ